MMLLTFFSKKALSGNLALLEYNNDTKTKHLFEAIAEALVGLIKTQPIELIENLESLLIQHAAYYPRQLPKHITQLCYKEQIEYLLVYTHPHKDVLIPSLAYTLQQAAIDIMCQYPEHYGNLLLEGHDIEALRKASDLDDSGLLQGLVDHLLHTSINLERYLAPYQLPVKEYYQNNVHQIPPINLHYQDNVYRSQHVLKGEK